MKLIMSDPGNEQPSKKEEFKKSINNLLLFFTSEEQGVASYASEQMKVILSIVEEHKHVAKLILLLPMKNPSFIKVINETDNYLILEGYLKSFGASNFCRLLH